MQTPAPRQPSSTPAKGDQLMTYVMLLIHLIRHLVSVITSAQAASRSEALSLSIPLRGAYLALAVAVAATVTATPGQAVPNDGGCGVMGKSQDENGEFQCAYCEIGEDTGTCVAICTNGTGGVFDCEDWA